MRPEDIIESLDIYGPMRIADFGAGAGHMALSAAKKLSDAGTVYALDIQEGPLEALRARALEANFENIKTIRADLERDRGSGLRDELVDAVFIANILFQAPDKKAILKEAFRILKKRGTLLIVEWNPEHKDGLGPKQHMRIPKQTLVESAESIGLSIIKQINLADHHYALVCKKP